MMHTPRLPIDFLVSYYYFQSDQAMTEITEHGRLRLIADSGAFSAYTQGARIDIDAYAAWIKRWQGHLYWAAGLDVFGDPNTTLANFRYLRDHHGLATVPTIHIGADPQHLDVYAAEGVDFVGLGGMVGMPKPNITRWLVHVMRYARDHHPHMRFHAWGMSSHSVLEKLPLYSVDSSGPLAYIHRYALLFLYSTRTRTVHTLDMKKGVPHQHRHLLSQEYNTTPQALHPVGKHNWGLLETLTVLSTQRRAKRLQAIHQVTPPRWGINPQARPLLGPRIHLVQTNSRALQHLNPKQGAA